MKELLIVLCFVTGVPSFTNAQKSIKLETIPLLGAKSVIYPTLNNLLNLIRIDAESCAATMAKYDYEESTNFPGVFDAKNTVEVFEVFKQKDFVDIRFEKIKGGYAEAAEIKFKEKYPKAQLQLVPGQVYGYAFDLKEKKNIIHYLIQFDKSGNFGGEGIKLSIQKDAPLKGGGMDLTPDTYLDSKQ